MTELAEEQTNLNKRQSRLDWDARYYKRIPDRTFVDWFALYFYMLDAPPTTQSKMLKPDL